MLKKIVVFLFWTGLFLIGSVSVLVYFYQDQIVARFVQESNRYLATPVQVKQISLSAFQDFPNITVSLDSVHLAGSLPNQQQALANVAHIDFSFDLWQLLHGAYVIDRVALREGSVYLLVDAQGQRNFNIFRPTEPASDTPKNTSQKVAFQLRDIVLDQVQIEYVDETIRHHTELVAQQARAILEVNDQQYDIQLSGDLLSERIQVDQSQYLRQKDVYMEAQLSYDHEQKHWQIAPSTLQLAEGNFLVSGEIDHQGKTFLDLAIKGQDTNIQNILSLLPQQVTKRLEAYRSEGNVYFQGKIKGDMPNPSINVDFGCQQASFYHPDYGKKLKQISLVGHYTNGSRQNLRTAELSLQQVQGTLDGRSVSGHLLIKNFDDYFIRCQVQADVDIRSALDFYPTTEVRSASGTIRADVSLEGKLSDMTSTQLARRKRTKSSGTLQLNDLHVQLQQYPLPLSAMQGEFAFHNNDVAISKFTGYVGHSHFSLDGFFRNAIAYLLSDTQPINIEADLYSKLVDLDEVLSGKLTTGIDQTASPQEIEQDWQATTEQQPYRLHIDPRLSLAFNCQVERLKFRRFKGRQLKSRLNIKQQIARVRNLSVQAAGGEASATGIVNAQRPDKISITGQTHFEQLQIDSVFYVFEDFQQSFLTAEHLKGKATADVDWKMQFDRALHLDHPSLNVGVQVSVADGELNNFEPMQSIARFVEDENLSQLRFKDMSSFIKIKDEKILIPPMTVHSNVSEVQVQGTHTFDQHIDYRFSLPMRNVHLRSDRALRRAEKHRKYFGEIVRDDAQPLTMFLTARGTIDTYKISYDFPAAKKAFKRNLVEEKKELKQVFKNKGKKATHRVELEDEYFDFNQKKKDPSKL